MEDTRQSFAIKKFLSIVFMALAFLMLNLSWIQFDGEVMDEIDALVADYEESVERLEEIYDGDIKGALEDQGYSKSEIEEYTQVLDATEKMVDVLKEGKYSVWSAVSLLTVVSEMKPIMLEDSELFGRADEEATKDVEVLQVLLGIIIGVFAFVGLWMILAIIAHLLNKRSLGIAALIFSIIWAGLVGFIGLAMYASEGEGNGITLAPILMVVFVIASCITWAMARKQTPQKKEDILY